MLSKSTTKRTPPEVNDLYYIRIEPEAGGAAIYRRTQGRIWRSGGMSRGSDNEAVNRLYREYKKRKNATKMQN